ncbi:MAG: ACP S-malonyltransferase [Evtepia gabavorous]
MGKIAFVFAGQGAQYPGMGQELAQCSPAAAEIFAKLDALRPGTSAQCFGGTDEELKETKTPSPVCLPWSWPPPPPWKRGAAGGHGCWILLGGDWSPDLHPGSGPGDRFPPGLPPGELMQAAAEEQPTAMAAVLKLSNEEVEQVCAQFAQVYPVNYNCPGQVSVACAKEQLAPFSAAVKAAGGRALPLKVRGGFHSPFMATAAQGFAQVLEECQVGQPEMPLYSNRTGAVYEGDPKPLLSQQIASPVRWETIVRNMIAAGADTFVELGPGKTLCGLIEKIDKTGENLRAVHPGRTWRPS